MRAKQKLIFTCSLSILVFFFFAIFGFEIWFGLSPPTLHNCKDGSQRRHKGGLPMRRYPAKSKSQSLTFSCFVQEMIVRAVDVGKTWVASVTWIFSLRLTLSFFDFVESSTMGKRWILSMLHRNTNEVPCAAGYPLFYTSASPDHHHSQVWSSKGLPRIKPSSCTLLTELFHFHRLISPLA